MMDLQNILNDEIAKAQGKSIAPSPKEIIKSQKEQEKAASKTVSTNPLAGVAAAVGTGAVEGVKSAASNAATMQSINTLKQEIGEIESARTRVQKAGTYTVDMAQQMDEQIALRKARITNLIEAQRNKNAASNARLQAVDERYELGRVGEFMQDLGSAAGNMAPSLGIGLINPLAGVAAFGMQSAAQGYGQALDEGATHEQAARYGVATGVKEAAIEKLTGGLGRFYGRGLIGNTVKNNTLRNVILNTAKGAAGEGAEEALSGAIDPYLQRATYNPEAENATAEELAYQAAIGAALGSILGGSSNVFDYRVNKGTKKAAQGAEMGAGQAQMQSMINNTTAEKDGLKGTAESTTIGANQDVGVNVSENVTNYDPNLHIDNRNYSDVGNRKVNAFQYDNPSVRPYIQAGAQTILADLSNTQKPTRGLKKNDQFENGEYKAWGTKRVTSPEIASLLDEAKMTYAQIEKGAQDLIADEGRENNANAKKVELAIDQMLSYGSTDTTGEYASRPNADYIREKAKINGALAQDQGYNQNLQAWLNGELDYINENPRGFDRNMYDVAERMNHTISEDEAAEIEQLQNMIDEDTYNHREDFKFEFTDEDIKRLIEEHMQTWGYRKEPSVNKNIYTQAYEEMVTGKRAAEKKALTEDEKNVKRFIQSAAVNARLEVKYDDLPTSRRAYYADGVLHINKNKLNEGMKVTAAHEIYHALEGTKEHEAVVELAIKARGGDAQSLIAQKIAEYARAGVTLDEAGARAEIGAEFIEKAMSDEATINRVLLENRTLAQRILQWIKDMLSVFEKRKTMSAEDLAEYKALLKARRQYEQGLAKLHEGKYEPAGVERNARYSLAENAAEEVKKLVRDRNYDKEVLLSHNTPAILVGQKGVKDLPMMMKASHIRENILSEDEAKQMGLRTGGNIHYHGLGDDFFLKIIDGLDNVTEAYRGTKNAENSSRRENYFLLIAKGTDKNGKEISEINVPVYINEKGKYNDVYIDINKIGTVFGRENFRKYIQRQIANGDLVRIKKRSPQASESPEQTPDNYSKITSREDAQASNLTPTKGGQYGKIAYADSIRNSVEKVNSKSAENEKNISQGRFAIDNEASGVDTDSRYGELIDEYGAMDKGMEPRVDVDVPKQTNEWDKTRRFTRTAMESENVSDEAKEAIADDLAGDIASGRFTYEPTSNEKLQEKANASIERNGYEGAKQGIFKKYRDNEAFKAEDVAVLEQLIVKASAEGRTQDAVDMIGLAAMVGTEMGQSVQALSMLKRMTPEGRLKQMELLRDRLNTKYGLTGEKQINVNERYKRMLLNKDNTAEDIEKVQSYIIDDMAKQLPTSMKDKFDAWRYLAMLGNPRTHIRNTVGNAMNLTISRLNDQLAGIVEANLLKEGQRTRAVGRVSKELKEFARQDWETEGKYRTDMSNKYGERGQAERNKQIFKTKGLESLRKFNENALDAEDTLFKKKQYTYALSHYMKANNITPAEMEQGGVRAEAARKFAEDEAYRVTFQEKNALANALNRFENKKTDSKLEKTGQMAVKALMPFKRTPLNILKRGVEYSPVGLANGLSDMYKLLRKDEGNATAVITEITQGMTGSAIVVLGYFLAEMGVLTAGYDEENKRRQNYENQLGGQNYAITLPGGGTYTLDWAAPAVMPLFVGAAVYDDIVSRTDDDGAKSGLLQSVLHGLVKVTDPVLEMSCMDSLQSALESYGNEGATSNMIVSAAKSYLMQFVPTLSGQVARTIDETKRSTYAPSDSPYTKTGESLGRQFMNKAPGLSYSSEPALDVWGREREQAGGNIIGRAALNMLSPGTYAPNKETMADKEIKRLYDALGEDKVIPKTAAKYVTKKIDGKNRTFYLTAKEYTAFQKKYGQDNFKAVSELMRSSVYKEMSDADKAAAIAEIYDYNGKLAKTEFFKGRKVAYDEAESMKKTLAESGSWVGYFEVKQAFPDQSYETAKKRKEKCDRYGINYTAYAESNAKISELKTANSARYEKAGDKTEANKRDIARYLASRRDLTDPQRQVLWEEIGNYKDTYKQTARRYGL